SADGHKNKYSKPHSSEDGYKLKSKPKVESRDSSKSYSTNSEMGSSANSDMTSKEKKKIGSKIRRIEATKGAIAVTNENAIGSAGYTVENGAKLFCSDYSMVLHCKKPNAKIARMVVKVINLTECSPRSRANLLQNSVRIMRYVSGANGKGKDPISPLFIMVH